VSKWTESWKDDDTSLEVGKEVIYSEKAALTKFLFCLLTNLPPTPPWLIIEAGT